MATHSSVLAWRIPGMVEPGGLPSMGSHRVGHDWSNLAAAAARLVIVFLPRGKYLLISWLQSPSAVILDPKKIKSITVSIFPPIDLPWHDGTRCHDVSFLNSEFQDGFFTLLFHLHQELLMKAICFLPKGWCHRHIWGYWYFSWQSWFQLVLHPAQYFAWCTLHVS